MLWPWKPWESSFFESRPWRIAKINHFACLESTCASNHKLHWWNASGFGALKRCWNLAGVLWFLVYFVCIVRILSFIHLIPQVLYQSCMQWWPCVLCPVQFSTKAVCWSWGKSTWSPGCWLWRTREPTAKPSRRSSSCSLSQWLSQMKSSKDVSFINPACNCLSNGEPGLFEQVRITLQMKGCWYLCICNENESPRIHAFKSYRILLDSLVHIRPRMPASLWSPCATPTPHWRTWMWPSPQTTRVGALFPCRLFWWALSRLSWLLGRQTLHLVHNEVTWL